jgi:hypothetical protein
MFRGALLNFAFDDLRRWLNEHTNATPPGPKAPPPPLPLPPGFLGRAKVI